MTRHFVFLIVLVSLTHCKNPNVEKTDSADTANQTFTVDTIQNKKLTLLNSIDREKSRTISIAGSDINKASISKSDSIIWIGQNKYLDHRIFGYEKPDTTSKRMILISVFTNDVEGNPFNHPLGDYYHSGSMENMTLKYVATEGQFVKVKVMRLTALKTLYTLTKNGLNSKTNAAANKVLPKAGLTVVNMNICFAY